MAKFKVLLERVETIIQQGAVMVEASTAEEAREIIRADLDASSGISLASPARGTKLNDQTAASFQGYRAYQLPTFSS